MALEAAKCPCCGADINIPNDRDNTFCSYCGSKIITQAAVAYHKFELSGKVEVSNETTVDKQIVILRKQLDMIGLNEIDNTVRPYNGFSPNNLEIYREIDETIKRIQDLDPENPCLYMVRDLFFSKLGSDSSNNRLVASIRGIFSPHVTNFTAVYKCISSTRKKGRLVLLGDRAGRQYTTHSVFTIKSFEEWEKDSQMNLARLDKWLNSSKSNVIIMDFVLYFIRFLMNQEIESYDSRSEFYSIKDGVFSTYDFDKYVLHCAITAKVTNDLYFTYEINPSKRKNVFFIADNVIEFLLPKLEKDLKSPNKRILIDAIIGECKKYPNSYYSL